MIWGKRGFISVRLNILMVCLLLSFLSILDKSVILWETAYWALSWRDGVALQLNLGLDIYGRWHDFPYFASVHQQNRFDSQRGVNYNICRESFHTQSLHIIFKKLCSCSWPLPHHTVPWQTHPNPIPDHNDPFYDEAVSTNYCILLVRV